MNKTKQNNSAWAGIALVIVGLAFLTDNLHFLPFHIPHYFFSWEMLFIVMGAAMLATGRRGGFVFLLIGAFFLIPEISGWPRLYVRDWWPLILVVIGISMIVKRRRIDSRDSSDLPEGSDFDVVSILSGQERVVDSDSFEGGKVTAIFGGAEIDLTKTKLGSDPAVIDIFVMCGGSTLTVPHDWKVQVDVTCLLGGFSDSRRDSSVESVDPNKLLILKGLILFGGGEIKRA